MKKINPKHKHIIRNVFFGAVGLGMLVFGGMLIWISTIKLPDFSSFDSRKVVNSTKIYDRTGEIVLYDLGSDARRTSIPVSEMGENIKTAVVAIEDAKFYTHAGIRPTSIIRALLIDITQGGLVQGGSTITQQVIKKSLLTDKKSPVRKIKEIILALKLDREYPKEEILGVYLNQNPYGGNLYGIQEASQAFFGKNPADLSLAEAAYMAAIPNAPTHYSPYGSYKDDLEARKNLVLSRELELGLITQEQFESAKAEVVTWKPQQSTGIKAPHFVFYIKDYLEDRYGVDMVESGGLKVISTLDYDLQEIAEKAVEDYTIGEHKQLDKLNAGFVAMDPKTGQILVMVGSRNYFDKDIDGNFNVTTARRQPGSSFKPYMYVTAFEKGYTPDTVLFDLPTEFNASCDPYGRPYPGTSANECYMPVNYDGLYHGPMDIRTAIGSSMNVPAVKMLYMIGVGNTIKTAQDMGITTLSDPSRYGLTLVLGGGEVRLLEAVGAYGTFAAQGVRHPYSGVLSVMDKNGVPLETWEDRPVTVLEKNATLQLSDVLSDNHARRLTFSANSPLYFPDRQVAVKTGTTNDFKDLWTIGYTPSLVAGVWAGMNDNSAMRKGITAAPIWHEFMAEALKKYPNETFEAPAVDPNYDDLPPILRGLWQGGTSYVVDTVSGKLATEYTPKSTRKEYVITDVHNILYWINRSNPTGPRPSNPASESLFNNWETAVQNWWAANAGNYPHVTEANKPTEYDDVHTASSAPSVSIISPAPIMPVSQHIPTIVQVTTSGPYPIVKIDVFLNNTFVGSALGTSFSFQPDQVASMQVGLNTLMVTATDSIGGSANTSQQITIQ